MDDFLPEARVTGEEPALAVSPPGVGESRVVVADLGEHPGTELDAESRGRPHLREDVQMYFSPKNTNDVG